MTGKFKIMYSTSASGSDSLSSSEFQDLRQMSIESDVFYPDLSRLLSLNDETPRFMTSVDPSQWISIQNKKEKHMKEIVSNDVRFF